MFIPVSLTAVCDVDQITAMLKNNLLFPLLKYMHTHMCVRAHPCTHTHISESLEMTKHTHTLQIHDKYITLCAHTRTHMFVLRQPISGIVF
jgi:hypothetical protein